MLPKIPTRLFDTSVFIDHLRGHSRAATALIKDAITGDHPAAFSIVTDAELWYGVKTRDDDRTHRLLLRNMNRLLLSLEIARAAGRLRRAQNNMQLTDALVTVVQAWDQFVRRTFTTPTALWYAPLKRDGIHLKETSRAIQGRTSMLGEDLRLICERAGVEYKSPHKLRHGHIVHARSLARNMDEVKAISQNVLHSTAIITDQVYSALKATQVQNTILNLGTQNKNDQADILRLIELLKQQLV